MDRCQSNNDLNINRCFQKNSDRWLVILKMCDISGPIFIDLTKKYRTKKYHRTVKIGKNTIKSLETVPFTSYIWTGMINFFFPWGSEVWSRQLAAVLGYTPLPPPPSPPPGTRTVSLRLINHFLTQQKPNENTSQLTGLTYTRILLSWQGWHTWECCSADSIDLLSICKLR